jgi:predicted deacylase
MPRLFIMLVVAAVTATASAQPLIHVRLSADHARILAVRLERIGYDVLEGGVSDRAIEMIVSDEELAALRAAGYAVEVIAKSRPFRDIQEERNAAAPDVPSGYLTLPEIITLMNTTAATYPSICKVVDLTTKYGTPAAANGNHLYALKISDNVAADEDEPAFLLVACHHAREVNSVVVAFEAVTRLTSGYGSNPAITDLVNKYEIWVIPVANPDGYDYMFNINNNWRKNRRPNPGGSFGVDQNRNYPIGWTASCAGSTTPSSDTYKGPSAGSEPETQTIIAFSNDRHLTKVHDIHSYGRETLYSYLCLSYPFTTFMGQQAAALSTAAGYSGAIRAPSAEGEEEEWQMAKRGSLAFLTEVGTEFQPTYASAQAEAAQVWGGVQWLLQRPITIAGHVRNAYTGQPVVANITYQGVTFSNGETNFSEPRFGRYHCFLPAGSYTIQFSAAGYISQNKLVTATTNTEQTFEIQLVPVCYPDCNGDGVLGLADFGCFQTKFALNDPYADCNGDGVLGLADFGCFQTKFALGCP